MAEMIASRMGKIQCGSVVEAVAPGSGSITGRVQAVIRATTAKFESVVTELACTHRVESAEELFRFETELQAIVARECCDAIVGAVILAAHDGPAVAEKAAFIEAQIPYLAHQRSSQPVRISLLGGSEILMHTTYRLQRPPRGPGHPRKKGSRKEEGNGLYPKLQALGICFRVTPALASVVARLVAAGPYDEAERNLEQRGLRLSRQVIRRITRRIARRGLEHRDWVLEQTQSGLRGTGIVSGKRIVISTDGGRLRIRKNKRGKPKKSSWHGFDADWREPKVLVIYEIDERGRKKRKGPVWYDATMGNADEAFDILISMLARIGAHEAKEWIFVADGALWIWDRIDVVVSKLGYDPTRVVRVLDYFHAVEHLSKIADGRKGWTAGERKAWFKKMKTHLAKGNVDKVLNERGAICLGRNAKALGKEFSYFEQRKEMMAYSSFKSRGIPCGSGAVESCVRRLVNLRMKGNGIFWDITEAEGILHLRAQLLTGRWNEFMFTILEHESLWGASAAHEAA